MAQRRKFYWFACFDYLVGSQAPKLKVKISSLNYYGFGKPNLKILIRRVKTFEFELRHKNLKFFQSVISGIFTEFIRN
ncbi:MAG: hypothetical protein NZT61_05705 [Deltaproteobacteria bacterium]|nr:hypothetical protein [Deltaproteobacteria bacterium]